tara:strand:- start:1541 stop:2365 length:825 start_codon:yes stop_codon:yes gene_type:complete
MNTIALDNLKIINEYKNNYYLIADGNKLSLIDKNDYDPINKLSSLEYPIYFTFHYLLNLITDDNSLSYQYRINLLENINYSLYQLMDFITDLDEKETEENKILIDIINNIDERYDIIHGKIKYTYCEKFILMFDNIIEGFKEAGKYLYLSGRPYVLDSDDEEKDFAEIMFEGINYLEDENTRRIYTLDHKVIGKWDENCETILWKNDLCKGNHLKLQTFTEINYEGVDYLEDENSGEIYSKGGVLIGKWNNESDTIIWKNDKYKENHLKLIKSD